MGTKRYDYSNLGVSQRGWFGFLEVIIPPLRRIGTILQGIAGCLKHPACLVTLPSIFFVVLSSILIYSILLDGHVFNAPLSVKDDKVYTEKRVYYPGETVYAYFNVEKKRAISATVQWFLIDTYMMPYLERKSNIPRGVMHKAIPLEKLSEHLPDGKYFFKGIVTYTLNDFNRITYTFLSDTFEVVNPIR